MKKQYNLSIYTRQVFALVLMSILFFACQEDEIIKSTDVKEGIPVKVSFNLSVPEMKKITTRGLRDDEEYQINDLYLLIFDARGERKEGTRFYSSDELASSNGNQNSPSIGTLKDIKTTSGVSYIFAAANTNTNQLSGDGNLKRKLDKVNTLDEFKQVTATLNSKTDAAQIDRTQAALVMCGSYNSGEEGVEDGRCVIPEEGGALNGIILLERLDSHITFNISWGGTDSKVTSFELTGWKVYNVPVRSYLLANEEDAVKGNKKDYSTSIMEHKATIDDKSCSFDFYMLENRKKDRMYKGVSISNYAEREAEVKDEEGLNTGEYKYIEPHATFVEIKANMELISSIGKELSTGKKIANVTYTIHLGGVNNNFADFKSERNKKYTYNVTINDTEDIRVEVQDNNERRPGVEGDVVDAKTKVYTLDAHYNCFNIGFTKENAQKLSFTVKTPYGDPIDNNANDNQRARGDYKWIRFAYTTNESTLAKYPANGEGLIDLFGLSADIEKQSQSNENETLYYTVFVDEYYYDKSPTGENWEKPYWKYFVNKENRDVILLFTPEYSTDQESSYADAQYMITQRSIQTYYSTKNFNEGQNALGMEHVNETGVPGNGGPGIDQTGLVYANGFYNTYEYIKLSGSTWSEHANMTTPNESGYTFTLKSQNGWEACLSRNRDENNNGKIDPEELKWYLPARDQLTGMYLGAESLSTPLFDADAYPKGTVTSAEAKYHYVLSSDQKFWANEGATFGQRNAKGSGGYPQQLRCVRNLNLDMNEGNAGNKDIKVGNAFKYNEVTRVFSMTYLDEKNIRGKLDSGELGLHDNFSSTNKPYFTFQMAERFHTEVQEHETWANSVNIDNLHRSKCSSYYEKADRSDKGKWRTPNQREFMLMYTQDKNFVNYTDQSGKLYRAYSRTEWKYNENRHFGFNEGILFLDSKGSEYNVSLRCVRDVDVDANGNIIETDSNGDTVDNY